MASIIGVETLQHTNGTTAATVKSNGTFYPTGGIVQVVGDSLNTAVSKSGTTYSDTGLSVNITPNSSSSKFLIMVNLGVVSSSTNDAVVFRLLRDSTEIGSGSGGNTQNSFIHAWQNSNSTQHSYSNHFLDTPSLTTQITYKLQWKMTSSTDTGYINRRNSDNYLAVSSNFTVMEIAG